MNTLSFFCVVYLCFFFNQAPILPFRTGRPFASINIFEELCHHMYVYRKFLSSGCRIGPGLVTDLRCVFQRILIRLPLAFLLGYYILFLFLVSVMRIFVVFLMPNSFCCSLVICTLFISCSSK